MQGIHDAGFKAVPEDVRLTVTGTVIVKAGVLSLARDRMNSHVELIWASLPASPDAAPHLARHVGEVVEAEGFWQPNGTGKLAVTALRVKGEPSGKHGPPE